MGLKHYRIALNDTSKGQTGAPIATAGGMAMICKTGLADQVAVKTVAGAAGSNPVALNYGILEFWTLDTEGDVDIYLMAPGGQFHVEKGVTFSGPSEINISGAGKNQVAVIPYSTADATASTEKDTGFDLPSNALVSPFVGLKTLTAQSTKTIDVGLLSTESGGDADGFLVALPISGTGFVAAKSASTATRGALIGAGTLDRGHSTDLVTSKSISYTLSSGTNAAAGFIHLPYQLAA